MARVKLNKKFEKYIGAPPPNGSRFYLTERYGETIMSHYPMHRDPESLTENQKISNNEFAQARALADAELKDPVKHEEWLRKWHNAITAGALQYKTLRGFTIAEIRKQQAGN